MFTYDHAYMYSFTINIFVDLLNSLGGFPHLPLGLGGIHDPFHAAHSMPFPVFHPVTPQVGHTPTIPGIF